MIKKIVLFFKSFLNASDKYDSRLLDKPILVRYLTLYNKEEDQR